MVRAIQTAELVTAGLGHDSVVDVEPALAPDGIVREVIGALRTLAPDAVVVLVGHEPGLSAIGAVLIGAQDFAVLGKACAARIDDGRVRWRLAWDAEAPAIPDR